VLISTYIAVHSELGRHITSGESRIFFLVGSHINGLLVLGGIYLLLVVCLQYLGVRLNGQPYPWKIKALSGVQIAAMAIVAASFFYFWKGVLPWGHVLLQVSIIGQVFAATGRKGDLSFSFCFSLFWLRYPPTSILPGSAR
jgi:tetrahydromethanopterin S-methyltransferase subunit E